MDLGTSLWYKTPVWTQLKDRLVTMELAVMAILLAFCAAVLPIISAVKQDTGLDYCSRVSASLASPSPVLVRHSDCLRAGRLLPVVTAPGLCHAVG